MATAKDAYRSAMREDLLGATERVIARKGLAGLTVRDVLAEAGVAPGTLYSYFTGKEELLEAMAQRVLSQYVDTMAGGGETSSEAAFGGLLRLAFSQPMEGASVLSDMRGRPGDAEHAGAVRQFNEDLVVGMRPIVDRARSAGGVDVEDGDALLELLDIIWDGMTRRAATDTFVTDYGRVGELALTLLEAAGLVPAASPQPAAATRSRR